MHMIFRTLWVFFMKRFLKTSDSNKSVITMRVLPTDLDLLWHVNNGVYFSFMDFGRWDLIFRNGLYDGARKKGWYSVVAGEAIKFKRSLRLWDKFQLETQVVGYDDKYFFIRQKFLRKNELMATGLVKVRFLKTSGGLVSPEEVLALYQSRDLPEKTQELSNEWYDLESKFMS